MQQGTDGLLHALLIGNNGVQRLDWSGLNDWLPEQGLLWAHFDLTREAAASWLRKKSALPRTVVDALLAEETRPRATVIYHGVVVNLRGVNLNPGADPEDMVSIRVWLDANRLITTRRRRLLSVGDAVESLQQAPISSPGELLVRIADALVSRVGDAVDDLEERIASLEQRVLDNADSSMRVDLAELRRQAIGLRRYLAPQREALGRLYAEPIEGLNDADRLALRETYDRQVRSLEDLDAFRERAAVIQEELLNQLSETLNRRTYVLSVAAALFLPLGFLTGLLGINVGGIPGADSGFGFLAFCAILATIAGLQVWIFRKKGWF